MMQHHVLMYHHVAPFKGRESLAPYIVEPDVFRRQLDRILESRLPVTTMAKLIDDVGNGRQTKRSVVITFDDCSQELFEFALPFLKERGMKASFYSVAGLLGGNNDWDRERCPTPIPLMSGTELKTLVDQGHEIGAHGLRHVALDTLTESEVFHEVVESKRVLEDVVGRPVQTMAYPFGGVPVGHRRILKEAGYVGGCSIFSDAASVLADPFSVRRILIHNRDIGMRFNAKLSRAYLAMRRYRDPYLLKKHRVRTEARQQ